MKNLKDIRDKRKITQLRLSTAIDVSQETISAYESGKSMPSAETLVRIADFLNTSTDYLLGRINNDGSLRQIMNEKVDEELEELINNYARLNSMQKKDLIWYSEALINKDISRQ